MISNIHASTIDLSYHQGRVTSYLKAFPSDAQSEQVIAAVGIMSSKGAAGESLFDLSRHLNKRSLIELIPVIKATELLGLVERDMKGDLVLTELGSKFNSEECPNDRQRILTERLSLLEPFQTAINLTRKKESVRITEVVSALATKGIRWHEIEVNLSIVRSLLVDWAIVANLLSYDGKTDRIERPASKA